VQILTGRGFKQVYNLKGGIAAWQGHAAAGPVEMGMMLLKGNETPREVICLAYGLEEGLRKFYSMSIKLAISPEVVGILTKLAEIEVKHKQRLFDLYITVDPTPLNVEAFDSRITSELMEGGFDTDKLLEQSMPAFKTAAGVLDFAMTLEAQAMDLYMRYAEKSADPEVKNVFYKMANEEKAHLKSLGDLLDKNMD
jgi:rubrerythrin